MLIQLRLWLTVWPQRKVIAHDKDTDGYQHQKHPDPNTPITMCTLPVGTMAFVKATMI
jgi:hypothetical protein